MQKVALITGAESGLGLLLAARLADKGWMVFAGRQKQESLELEAIKAAKPDNLAVLPLDVSSDESVRAAAATVSQLAGHLDLLVSNVELRPSKREGSIREAQDSVDFYRYYDINTIGHLRIVNRFLPLLDKGQLKRICFVSSENGSVNLCDSTELYGFHMSRAAMNMEVKIMFNRLRPEGYTFRMYVSGSSPLSSGSGNPKPDVKPENDASAALAYFLHDRFEDEGNMERKDDNRLAVRDWLGREWPW